MPSAQGTRRACRGGAGGLTGAFLAAVVLCGGGCNRLPLRQAEATATARPTTRIEPSTPPAELPPLPSSPIAEAKSGSPPPPDAPEPVPARTPARSTPLLDSALARASEVREVSAADAPVELPVLSPPADLEAPRTGAEAGPAEAPKSLPVVPTREEATPVPKPIDPEKPAAVMPRDAWRDGLGDLRAFAAKRAGERGGTADVWLTRSRVIDWLSSDPNDSPPDLAWTSALSALVAATGPGPIDPETLVPRIRQAVVSLDALAPLSIVDLKVCRKVQGFGLRDVLEPAAVRSGQALLVYCEVAGLHYEAVSEGFRSRLTSEAEILSAAGGEPVWAQALGSAEDVCRQPRRDYFINYRIPLPTNLAPGEYLLRLTQRDLASGRDASASVAFRVNP